MHESQEPKYDAIVIDQDGNEVPLPEGHRTVMINRETRLAIPDDEGIFVLRFQDAHAIGGMQDYWRRIQNQRLRDQVSQRIQQAIEFRHADPERMKEPD